MKTSLGWVQLRKNHQKLRLLLLPKHPLGASMGRIICSDYSWETSGFCYLIVCLSPPFISFLRSSSFSAADNSWQAVLGIMLEAQTFCVVKSKEELKVRDTVGREQQNNSQGLSSDNQTWLAGKSPIHRWCFHLHLIFHCWVWFPKGRSWASLKFTILNGLSCTIDRVWVCGDGWSPIIGVPWWNGWPYFGVLTMACGTWMRAGLGNCQKMSKIKDFKPIRSMYAIYGNIYHQYTPNVSIYTSTMDPMGNCDVQIFSGFAHEILATFFEHPPETVNFYICIRTQDIWPILTHWMGWIFDPGCFDICFPHVFPHAFP